MFFGCSDIFLALNVSFTYFRSVKSCTGLTRRQFPGSV